MRQGTYSCAIGDLLVRFWGFTDAQLRMYSSGKWDLLMRRGLKNVQARARLNSNEGSAKRKRALGQLVDSNERLSLSSQSHQKE